MSQSESMTFFFAEINLEPVALNFNGILSSFYPTIFVRTAMMNDEPNVSCNLL